MWVLSRRCACSVIGELAESGLKEYLLVSKETILPRDLLLQMGYTQLCATVKAVEVAILNACERSCRRRCAA